LEDLEKLEVMPEIAVSILVYNEGGSLSNTLSEGYKILKSLKIDFEFWVFDNNSTDTTQEIIKNFSNDKKEIKYYKQEKNVGYGLNSISAMKTPNAKNIFVIDGDGQYDFKDIPKFISKLNQGYDVIFGCRQKRQDPSLRKITTYFFNLFAKNIIRSKINDINCGFRACNKNSANRIESKYKYNYIGPEIYMEAKKKNLSITEEEVNHCKRIAGKSYFDGITTIFLNALIMIKYLFQLRNNYISKKN